MAEHSDKSWQGERQAGAFAEVDVTLPETSLDCGVQDWRSVIVGFDGASGAEMEYRDSQGEKLAAGMRFYSGASAVHLARMEEKGNRQYELLQERVASNEATLCAVTQGKRQHRNILGQLSDSDSPAKNCQHEIHCTNEVEGLGGKPAKRTCDTWTDSSIGWYFGLWGRHFIDQG
uniref:Uncharacterized protein n=1 Tax=Sphaerodactylus townsendi TaxID=933632 RepID=A0ACB8FPK8_9SAUR